MINVFIIVHIFLLKMTLRKPLANESKRSDGLMSFDGKPADLKNQLENLKINPSKKTEEAI